MAWDRETMKRTHHDLFEQSSAIEAAAFNVGIYPLLPGLNTSSTASIPQVVVGTSCEYRSSIYSSYAATE